MPALVVNVDRSVDIYKLYRSTCDCWQEIPHEVEITSWYMYVHTSSS